MRVSRRWEGPMSVYMMQLAYTSEAWSALLKAPEDRAKVARSLAESLGGENLGFWLSLGDYDVVALFDLPDQMSVAALSMAVSAGGAIRDAKTTPLMSTDEAMRAMTKAQTVEYSPPAAMWSARTAWSEPSRG
jgi:uncharacterized protein with GYD domain